MTVFSTIDSAALSSSGKTTDVERGAGINEAQARRVAAEFEALLLAQLTASLNPTESDDEESNLFGGSGSSMYKQMFSEQMASAMAKAGGIGMSDVILKQLGIDQSNTPQNLGTANERAFAAARSLRSASPVNSAVTLNSASSSAAPTFINQVEDKGLGLAARESYPEPIIVSEAGPEKVSAPPDHRTATRPRRVFSVAPVADGPNASPGTKSPHVTDPVTLQMPVHGRLSSRFGLRRDPIHGRYRNHTGVDIAAPRGTPIGAAAEGTVVFAGRQRGYGNTVVIEHPDGRRTRYAHANRLMVARGDHVEASQVIATVGSTGRSTGPHLHFEVTEHNRRVDPLRAITNDLTLARR